MVRLLMLRVWWVEIDNVKSNGCNDHVSLSDLATILAVDFVAISVSLLTNHRWK
jgi:hypothetical protein